MHPYGTDSRERISWVVALVVVSIFASRLARWLLQFAGWEWPDELGLLLDPVSAAGIFGVLLYCFDQRLWKSKVLHRLGLVSIPDVSGLWTGGMHSSFHNFKVPTSFVVEIQQSWSRMCVRLWTATSHSHSETASFILDAGSGRTLSYTYLNRPKSDQDPELAMHQGTTILVLSSDQQRFEGEYYSSRGRANFGKIWMNRATDATLSDLRGALEASKDFKRESDGSSGKANAQQF